MALSVKLCASIDTRLRSLARELNCSQHWIMCEAIRQFVEAEEAKRFQANEARLLMPLDMAETGASPE